MPELPEVETVRRGLEPHLVGRRIVGAASFPHPKFRDAVAAIGPSIDTVGRRGKYLLIGLDDDREMVIHLGMTGQLAFDTDPGDPHVRATWALDDGATLTFRDVRRFGRIRVVQTGDYGDIPTLDSIGPEPFDAHFTGSHLFDRLGESSRAVKTQLLSQRPVAGVGNIYADEALWMAGVDPSTRRLSRPRSQRLRDAIVEVLGTAVTHGGTTLRDYRTVEGAAGGHQHHLHCYGRAGEPCERCGTVLRRKVVDARGTTWCGRCQRR